jgi:hypothetical protein
MPDNAMTGFGSKSCERCIPPERGASHARIQRGITKRRHVAGRCDAQHLIRKRA